MIISGNAGEFSEKQSRLSYTFQPFVKKFHDAISSVQLLAVEDSYVFLSPNLLRKSDNLSAVYYAFDHPYIKFIRSSLSKVSQRVATIRSTKNFTQHVPSNMPEFSLCNIC